MKNKIIKIVCMIALIVLGGIAIGFSFLYDFSDKQSNLSSLLIGGGAGIIGASIAQLVTISIYNKRPELLRKKTIEVKDERTTIIRDKAKGKVYSIFNLLFPMIIFGLALANVSYMITGVLLGIYVLRTILFVHYFNKYNNEM